MKTEFAQQYDQMMVDLHYRGMNVPQSTWQSQQVATRPGMEFSRELRHVTFWYKIPETTDALQQEVEPNLPWAEDHFQERVSGQPLNPPPSEAWWPYRVQGNAEHKAQGEFSHTYPERFWPRWANTGAIRPNGRQVFVPHNGVRYEYGDLDDVLSHLTKDPLSRQAYLPVWFPEDTGAVDGQRVPCTLGYHFLYRPDEDGGYNGEIVYNIRSCDLFRHFTDDVYMACRLLQWLSESLQGRGIAARASTLIMHISSLHLFAGDLGLLAAKVKKIMEDEEPVYGTAF